MTKSVAEDRFARDQRAVDKLADAHKKAAFDLEGQRVARVARAHRFNPDMEQLLALKARDPAAYSRLPAATRIAAAHYAAGKAAREAYEAREEKNR